MRVYDQATADKTAKILRKLADAVDRREVKFVALLPVFTLEGAEKRGYVLENHVEFIETVGEGEYLLLLGALRDFYLTSESVLVERGTSLSEGP